MIFGSRPTVGIDLGKYSVKWAAVDQKRLECSLWSQVLVPDRSSREDSLEGQQLTDRLQELLVECKASVPSWSKMVSTAVHRGCLGGYLELPKLSDKELQVAVPGAAIRQIPYALDEVSLTYRKLPALSGQGNRCGIFFLAVQREVLQKRQELLKGLGLEVQVVDLSPLALAREFGHNRKPGSDELHGLVHVGFEATQVVMLRGEHPVFYRSFAPARGDFVYAFQMGAQVDWREAEARLAAYDATRKEVAMEPVMQRWLRELSRSLQSLSLAAAGVELRPQRLHLSGGGLLIGLDRRLEAELGIPTAVDSWERLKPSDRGAEGTQGPIYKVALGLAMAG